VLEIFGLVVKTRNVGHTRVYGFNIDNLKELLLQKFNIQQALNECD
jgi:hypothetical protein